MHLWSQDFESVSEYSYAIFRITSQLELFGENITSDDMLKNVIHFLWN